MKIKTMEQFWQLYREGWIRGISPEKFRKLRGRRVRGRYPVTVKVEMYDIGIHPGVNARRLGLRRWFEYLWPLYVKYDVIRTLERITGVKIL